MSEYHETAFARDDKTGEFKTLMVNYGFVKYYQRKEHHEWNAPMARLLHEALRDGRPATKAKEGVEKGALAQQNPIPNPNLNPIPNPNPNPNPDPKLEP